MPRHCVLTRHLVIVLSVWIGVCGLAAFDLFDLTDELLQPVNNMAQVIEPELDELDEEDGPVAAIGVTWATQDLVRARSVTAATIARSSPSTARPLYQRLAQYRI